MKKIKDMILKKVMIVLTCFMLVFSSTANKCYAFDYALTSEAIAFIVAVLGFVGITCQNKTTYSKANELANDFVNFYAEACDFTREESIRQINRAGADGQLPTSGITGSIYYSCDMLREWAPSIIDWINENILPNSNLSETESTENQVFVSEFFRNFQFVRGNVYPPGVQAPASGELPNPSQYTCYHSPYYMYNYKYDVVEFKFSSNINIDKGTGWAYAKSLNTFTRYTNVNSSSNYGLNIKFDCIIPGSNYGYDSEIYYFNPNLTYHFIFNDNILQYFAKNNIPIKGNLLMQSGKLSYLDNPSLELDPDILYKNDDPTKYVIDFNPYFERYYDSLSNSIDLNDKTIISSNATFNEDTHVLTNSGSIAVDLDKANDRVALSDKTHSLVLDTDISNITDSTITDTYPDEDIIYDDPTDYTADWTTVFPFCIPFDIFRFIKLLSAEPEAPKFEYKYNYLGMKGSINIDLSVFDDIARICRNMQDLIFIVGLAMVTRAHLIKA